VEDTRQSTFRLFFFLAMMVCAGSRLVAQQDHAALPDAPQPQVQAHDGVNVRDVPRDVIFDQGAIWSSPARLRARDSKWLVPLALATGAAIATDHRAMSQVVTHDANFNNANTNTSNVLIGGFIAAPVVLYGYGHFRENDHARESGLVSAEALLDGLVVQQGIKLIAWRERPAVDSQRGRFFRSSAGVDSSFPSSHSVLAWATASAIAGEYPSRWTQIFAYSAATSVSLTRVLGQQHFPSDVLVGGTAGWLVGRYIVHRRGHRGWTR
jgi:hypothetical protein